MTIELYKTIGRRNITMDEKEQNGMNFLDFLYKISFRPPLIIFVILGFILVYIGWSNLYSLPNSAINLGNVFVGLTGFILVIVACFIEFKVREVEWKEVGTRQKI